MRLARQLDAWRRASLTQLARAAAAGDGMLSWADAQLAQGARAALGVADAGERDDCELFVVESALRAAVAAAAAWDADAVALWQPVALAASASAAERVAALLAALGDKKHVAVRASERRARAASRSVR